MHPALIVILIAIALAVVFHLTFVLGGRLRNYGIVDAVWALSFGPVALGVAATFSGWVPRRYALAVFAGAWSLRLGLHLARRVASHHPVEDTRYASLRETWRNNLPRKMAGFFQGQAVSVWVLALPYYFIGYNAKPAFGALELAAGALWLVAWAGEALADRQLARFKAAHPEGVCDRGLWRFSRHPNYFFEWLGWVSFALAASATPWGWLAWLSPAVMLHLLLNVTGVPLTEERSLARRGDAYRRYQARTSPFFPWFPRTESTPVSHD